MKLKKITENIEKCFIFTLLEVYINQKGAEGCISLLIVIFHNMQVVPVRITTRRRPC